MAFRFRGKPRDLVLFVLGGEAVGKSTLINHILNEIGHPSVGEGGMRMEVRHSLVEGTQAIRVVRLEPTRGEYHATLSQIVLVDVPYLADNDVKQHDRVVLDTTGWLSKYYPSPMTRDLGIIYVQDVSMCPLITSAIHLNLKAPTSLANSINCGKILVVTTKWDKLPPDQVRQVELITSNWPNMIPGASPSAHKIEKDEHDTEGSSALAAVWKMVGHPVPPGYGLSDDITLLIIGPIKAGKSTFINAVLRHCGHPARMEVASTLSPTTDSVCSTTLISDPFSNTSDRRIVLVDTPGFVGSEVEDNATLRSINTWYKSRYRGSQITSCCVIYLHDISQDKFTTTAESVLSILPRLIRKISVKKVLIVSTKWDRSFENEGHRREAQLQAEYWSQIATVAYTVRRLPRGSSFGGSTSGFGDLLFDALEHV